MSITKRDQENKAMAERELPDDTEAAGQPDTGKPSKSIEYSRPGTSTARRGFFTIYKKGQGYWTRMGTLVGAATLGILLSYTLFSMIPPTFFGSPTASETQLSDEIRTLETGQQGLSSADLATRHTTIVQKQAQLSQMLTSRVSTGRAVAIGISGGFLVIYTVLAVYLMNKPANVDFLIATDSEMKKVNWTSRRELIGSTKIVVIFMVLIALYLFVNDLIFGYVMYFLRVLKFSPFNQP